MIPTDEQIIEEARKYSYSVLQLCNADMAAGRIGKAETVSRHAQNNAFKYVGYAMKVAEQDDYAPSIGAVLEEMRQSISKEKASE